MILEPWMVAGAAGVAMIVAAVFGWFADRYDERADARQRNDPR